MEEKEAEKKVGSATMPNLTGCNIAGTPKTVMNLVTFPAETMDLSILRQIIQGGVDKLKEA